MNAAARYIASVYESCIDRSLNLAQIGQELAQRGIRRTPYQVRHDFDSVCTSSPGTAPAVPIQSKLMQGLKERIESTHNSGEER